MFDIHQTCAAAYQVAVEGDDFRFHNVNAACLAKVGLVAGFHPGLTPRDIFPEPVAEEILQRYRACRDTRQAVSYISEIRNGQRWRTTLFPVLGSDGSVALLVGICADADDESTSKNAGRSNESSDVARLVLNALDSGFWIYEVATGHFETSAQLTKLIAGPAGRPLDLVEYVSRIYPEDLAGQNALSADDDRSEATFRIVVFDGRTRWMSSKRRVVRNDDGVAVRIVGLVSDITEQQERLLTLASEASTDALTSLNNRRTFERAVAASLHVARKAKARVGLLLIDLDGFKPINDRYGHRTGDAVLRKVARRLKRQVREPDMLARIGGDEFAVLVNETSTEKLGALADRIDRAFTKPFALDGRNVFVGVSIGIAVSTSEDKTIDALVERADRYLYAVKRGRQAQSA